LRRQGYGYPDDDYFFLKLFDASRKNYVRNPLSHKICDWPKISIAVVIVLLVVVYFFPLPLDKIVVPNGKITIAQTIVSVENGIFKQTPSTYEFLPGTDSYNKVMSIFSKYSYRRNLRSLLITHLQSIKNYNYYFYYDIDKTFKIMELSGTGEFVVDNHSYNMGFWGKSEQTLFMDEIKALLSTETPIAQSQWV